MVETLTVELDAETADGLKRLSQVWGVSTEDAVRLAVRSVSENLPPCPAHSRLDAFKQLQALMRMTPEKAIAWSASVEVVRR